MLNLKNTTLLFVETRAHEITKRVIADCLLKADFGEVLIFTDKPELLPVPGARYVSVPDFPNKKLAGEFYYGKAMAWVETDYALMLEWDAGIFDATKWRPEFFDYDYIGAPWQTTDQLKVGNGGFTLMSKKLGHFACENLARFPVDTDWNFCRIQRRHYEDAGFKWPSAQLASFFAWELGQRNAQHFGYHGAFNWPVLLPRDEIIERAHIMLKSEYLTLKLREVFRHAPWLADALGPAGMETFVKVVPSGYVLRPKIPGMMSNQQRAAMLISQGQRRAHVINSQTNTKGLKA